MSDGIKQNRKSKVCAYCGHSFPNARNRGRHLRKCPLNPNATAPVQLPLPAEAEPQIEQPPAKKRRIQQCEHVEATWRHVIARPAAVDHLLPSEMCCCPVCDTGRSVAWPAPHAAQMIEHLRIHAVEASKRLRGNTTRLQAIVKCTFQNSVRLRTDVEMLHDPTFFTM